MRTILFSNWDPKCARVVCENRLINYYVSILKQNNTKNRLTRRSATAFEL